MLSAHELSTLETIEREAILRTLYILGGDKRETARTLGISLKTLYNKLNRYRRQGFYECEMP